MKKDWPGVNKRVWILLSGVFLTSFSLITFEITLSRLLSVLLSYHYVFIVLSLTLFGLGMGGILVHFLRLKISKEGELPIALPLFASFYALTISFSTLCLTGIAYFNSLLVYSLILIIPFLFAGMLFAEIYSRFPEVSGRIYGMDLIGGSAGAMGIIPLLNLLGGINAGLLFGNIASLAALLFTLFDNRSEKKRWFLSIGNFLILFFLWMASISGYFALDLPIGKNPDKEIHDALYASSSSGKIILTRWSAFGRTDLVFFGEKADYMDLYIDGTAGSPMYRFNGHLDHPDPAVNALRLNFPGFLPLLNLKDHEKDHILIIGPGGGRDVLLALMAGFQKITAVEVNRDLVEIVRKYSSYNGGVYEDANQVRVVIGEGRHFLKRHGDRYDMILLCLPVTHTSRSLEGYALTENFLFTTESIEDYLNRLTEEGRFVVVAHNDAEILRLLSISLNALNDRGITTVDAMKQIYIMGHDLYPVFVLKKKPFTATETFPLFQTMDQFEVETKSSYLPFIGDAATLNPALVSLASGGITLDRFIQFVKERGYDISPVSDNRPFFYKIERGIPKSISLVFWLSMILWSLIAWIPLILRREKATQGQKDSSIGKGYIGWRSIAFFSMLGMGFMLSEISLIQRLTLFLGQPTISLALLIFSLLGWAGLGSLWSGRLVPDRIRQGILLSSLTVVIFLILYVLLLPPFLDQLLWLALPFRVLIANLILAPLGFSMGLPFPLGIRSLKEIGMANHIPWMWGVNGGASVLGSAMTIFIALSFGFTQALIISAGCYLIVFFLFLKRG